MILFSLLEESCRPRHFCVFFTCFPGRVTGQRSNEQHLHYLHNELCVWDWLGLPISFIMQFGLVKRLMLIMVIWVMMGNEYLWSSRQRGDSKPHAEIIYALITPPLHGGFFGDVTFNSILTYYQPNDSFRAEIKRAECIDQCVGTI